LHVGLTYRSIPELNSRTLFVNVASLDETVALIQGLGGSIVRRETAVPEQPGDDCGASCQNVFRVWESDPSAFPR
jgi:predicted enzyme related to lactoylglutathione lyase